MAPGPEDHRQPGRIGLIDAARAYLETLSPRELAEYLVGGLATSDLPEDFRSPHLALARESTAPAST